MLAKVTSEFPYDWNKYLPAVLFAYNKTLHRVTGFSSHELIFGTSIRGPVSFLRHMWVRPDISQYQTFNSYLSELRQRTVRGCQIARDNPAVAGEKQRIYCNQGGKFAVLKPNDEVLIFFYQIRLIPYYHHDRFHLLSLSDVLE